jgi:hypothetical protein
MVPSRLANAQITAQERLRALTQRGLTNAWTRLPGYDEEHVAAWLARAVPFVAAAQRQSVLLTDAYLARSLERPPVGVDAAAVIASVRGSTSSIEVYRRPFVRVWMALSKSTPYEQAVAAGLAHATASAAADVQMAQRAAMQFVQQSDRRIRGYQRVADGGACLYCSMIDGAFVRTADAMPLHPHCGCTLEPVEDDVEDSTPPDGVEVFEHGELGPMLGDPAHDHTVL